MLLFHAFPGIGWKSNAGNIKETKSHCFNSQGKTSRFSHKSEKKLVKVWDYHEIHSLKKNNNKKTTNRLYAV